MDALNIEFITDSSTVKTKLDKLTEKDIPEGLSEALEKACLILEAKAKDLCPVGRTGLLRSSITSKVEGLEGAVGSNMEYAPFVELGTGVHAKNGDGRKTAWFYWDDLEEKLIRTAGQEPQPFLENAAEEAKSDIIRCFEGVLK